MDSFEEHADAVYGWAYRLLGRHHDALDVVQEVFLRWSRQCADRTPTKPRGWLRRVTLNKAIDVIRKTRPTAAMSAELEASNPRDGRAFEPADRDALRGDIAVAIEGLTDAQRSVLVAKVYDEMTFAQIANELEVAVSTVKTHYARAVCAVRDRLKIRWLASE